VTDTIRITKPMELVEVIEPTSTLFELLGKWFNVPGEYEIKLASVDEPSPDIESPEGVTAFAMRKLQALRHAATPGVPAASDVIVALIMEIERALEETPQRLALTGSVNPTVEARSEFLRCVQAVNRAGDAVGRLSQAHNGAIVHLA